MHHIQIYQRGGYGTISFDKGNIMAILIELFERTGPSGAPVDEAATNNNWKSEDRRDSLYKYYYYPIKKPEGDVWVIHSVPRFLFGRISGTFSEIKRVRWKITGLSMGSGLRLYLKQTHTYIEPTNDFDGSLIYGNSNPLYIFPNLSTVNPTSASTRVTSLNANTTYYTDFIKSQLWVDEAASVGNTTPVTFELICDEYE